MGFGSSDFDNKRMSENILVKIWVTPVFVEFFCYPLLVSEQVSYDPNRD